MNKEQNSYTPLNQQLNIAGVSNRYICGVDYGDGKSQGAFTVFKDGKLKWHTQKLWKAKLYLWWMKVKCATIIRETA
ncbi:MAG: hypothetical protein KKC03_01130 [Bacteroidetes bacterium]|nr:hypothetical protein [Bacteroidota bacterium]